MRIQLTLLLALLFLFSGCATHPKVRAVAAAPDRIETYVAQADAIACPGATPVYRWCAELKQELTQSRRDGALEKFKRALGQLLVAVSISEVAHHRHEVLLTRPVNGDAYVHMAEGAPTKGIHIKGKSSDWGPQRGYIPVDERYSKLAHITDEAERASKIDKYSEKNRETIALGYAVAVPLVGPEGVAVVRGTKVVWVPEARKDDLVLEVLGDAKSGRFITADVDMLAFGKPAGATEVINDSEMGTITPSEIDSVLELNSAFLRHGYKGGAIVQHGAEARFTLSDGVDFPVTSYEPGGKVVVLHDERALRKYYRMMTRQGFVLTVNPNWKWKAL